MNILDVIVRIRGKFEETIMRDLVPKVRNVDFVYHYTSIDSLLGINKTNELWLSHISYMNDPLETIFGINTIIDLLNRQAKLKHIPDLLLKSLETRKQLSLDLKTNMAFVLSVTELADNKSFWMQYANQGKGVSIQFKNHEMMKILGSNVHSINMYFPVQYYSNDYTKSTENIDEFEQFIIDYYSYLESNIDTREFDDWNMQSEIFEISKLLACFIKNDFYKQEKEWRFAVFAQIGSEDVKVVPKGDSVRTLYILKTKENKLFNLIENIQIGPAHNKEKKVSSALELAIYKKQNLFYNIGFSGGNIV